MGRRRIARARSGLIVVVAACAAGCASSPLPGAGGGGAGGAAVDGALPLDGGALLPDGGPTCDQLRGAIAAWLASHTSCTVDADCTAVTTPCGTAGQCGAAEGYRCGPSWGELGESGSACYPGPCP